MAVISIIDDDASVRVATHRLLRSLGHVAYTFASADDFLRSSQLNDTSGIVPAAVELGKEALPTLSR